MLLTLAGLAGLLALVLAIAALTARGENPLAYPTVIPPPPVAPATPATPANPGPDIFGPASDTGNANNTPAPPRQPGAKPDANANLPTETPLNCPAKFITCLAQDHQGNIWAGSEDDGCLRYTPSPDATPDAKGTWTQFTGADLGGDNSVYAIAVDKLNRIWCGTLNHGVAVYNGEKWQSYSVIADPTTGTLAGPLGARVFAIATSPLDGDIWIATDAGLSRYSLSKDTWSYYTRGMSAGSFVAETQGLPSDQIAGIAFTKKGRILLATQCDGVATADPVDGYKKFRNIRGPDLIPVSPSGDGLPTNLCNAILVARDGTIYLATTTGLAMSKDDGDSWQYIRGRDYAGKARGLYQPRGLVLPTSAVASQLLPEDYVVSLAEDSRHRLWAGYRAQGYTVTDPATGTSFWSKSDPKITEKNNYVTAILAYRSASRSAGVLPAGGSAAIPPRSAGTPPANNQPAGRMPALQPVGEMPALHASILIARYGAGLSQFNPPAPAHALPGDSVAGAHRMKTTPGGLFLIPDDSPDSTNNLQDSAPARGGPADHIFDADSVPTPALPLAAAPPTADELEDRLAKIRALPKGELAAAYLGADWITQGDWVGHYGRDDATLCAMRTVDEEIGRNSEMFKVICDIGPHHAAGDELRHWIHWVRTTDPRVLYDPALGIRRQAEQDDHSEAYSRTYEGPDLWYTVTIPKGLSRVSLYFMNKDGHSADRWSRDFLITVRAAGSSDAQTEANPVLASARVCNFWDGVYHQFILAGPGTWNIRVGRNYSFDTICSGIFIDQIPAKDFGDGILPWMANIAYPPPAASDSLFTWGGLDGSGSNPPYADLWAALDAALLLPDGAGLQRSGRIFAYRGASSEGASSELRADWRWRLRLWSPQDRADFDRTMQSAWAKMQQMFPYLRKKSERPFSPGTE